MTLDALDRITCNVVVGDLRVLDLPAVAVLPHVEAVVDFHLEAALMSLQDRPFAHRLLQAKTLTSPSTQTPSPAHRFEEIQRVEIGALYGSQIERKANA
jgi:hypothetical protein